MKVKELQELLKNLDPNANINFLDNCLAYHENNKVMYIDENSYIKLKMSKVYGDGIISNDSAMKGY